MNVALLLFAVSFVVVVAAAAIGAAVLARIDGATYAAAFRQAATTFAAVINLTAAVTATVNAVLTRTA